MSQSHLFLPENWNHLLVSGQFPDDVHGSRVVLAVLVVN